MKRLMVFLAIFLAIILALNGEIWAVTITLPQANNVIQTGSASTSAANFFNLLAGSLSSDMTQIDFAGYYTPNFVNTYTQTEYQGLLNSYLSDIANANYAQAQIDLIKLAAATFKNDIKEAILDPLGAANNPWGSGKFYVTDGVGTSNQQMVQFFVDQFVTLYPHIPAGTTHGVLVPVLNPGQTESIELEAGNDTGIMDGIALTAGQQINSTVTNVEQQMNNVLANAKADTNIGTTATKQGYITQLSTTVTTGVSGVGNSNSLQALAANYNQQISTAAATGVQNLNTLATGPGNSRALANAYISQLNARMQYDQGLVAADLSSATSNINSLQQTIATTIDGLGGGSSPDSGGIGKTISDALAGLAGSLGTAVVIFMGKYCMQLYNCAKGIGLICPPEFMKGLADSLKKAMPTNFSDLLKMLGQHSIAGYLDQFPKQQELIIQNMADSTGLTVDQINGMLQGPGSAGTKLDALVQKVSTIKAQVQEKLKGATPEDILTSIGNALAANPNGTIQEITTAAVSSLSTISTGTADEIEVPNATLFNNMQYSSVDALQSTLINNIQTNGISLADFQAQAQALEDRVNSGEALSAAQKADLLAKISAAKNIINEAKSSPEDDIFAD
jgi:hypothetical protein